MRRYRTGLTLQPTGQRGRGKGNSCKEVCFPQAMGDAKVGGARTCTRLAIIVLIITRPLRRPRGGVFPGRRSKKVYGSTFCTGTPPSHRRGARWLARRRCGGSG